MADITTNTLKIGDNNLILRDADAQAKITVNTQNITQLQADTNQLKDDLTTVESDVTDLKDGFSDFKTDVFEERITPSANLFPSQILTEGSVWNCWTATVYTESNNNYACFEFSIPEGADYISANYAWAENSFSAFVDNNYAKLDLIKNTKQSGSGYIYAIPQGTTKACVSFNNTPGGHHDKYVNDGIVFIVGNSNITDKTIDDYAETKEYFADNLKLASENNETIPSVVDNLDGKIDTIADLFTTAKNLFTGITVGKYVVAWNIGDTVTTGSGANYAYGYADVEGCEKVTVNMSSMSDAYSFFTDADHKKVAISADNRIGTTRVYNVPTGAKYFYISSNNKPVWSEYGLVAFSGNSDIATNPASAEIYPYNVEMYYADDLKLFNGGTIGSKLENTGMVFHVEKDGSGDFTSFVEAIQEATKYMDSVVYVGAGEWDIIDEFGSTYMESVTSDPTTWGLVLKNRVHVVGTAKTIITAKYTGTTENTRQYFSAFNAGAYGFTLENLEIDADNIRYVMHDDRGNGGQTPYTNRYINVSMKLTHGYYGDTALGGGLGVNGTFEIINCRFEGSPDTHRLAYYHGNNYGGETGAKCKIIVQGCYFADNGSFDVTKYGDSTEMTTAYLSNNSFGSAPQVTSGSYAPQDNMQIVAWCNEIRNA